MQEGGQVKIVAAYKPSQLGDAVLDAATAEARRRDADLVIARHVKAERPSVSGPLALMDPSADGSAGGGGTSTTDKLREDLDALAAQLRTQGVRCEAVLLADADNHADAILALARNAHADLLVVGIQRRTRVGKMVLRSEAQQLLLESDCPVLAVKSD